MADAVLNPALSGFFMEKVQLLFATCRSSVMLAYLEGGCYGYFAERNFVGIFSPLVWRLEFKIQLLNKRFVKTIVMVTAMTAVLVYDWSSPKLIAISLLYALWIQFQFWSRAVGAILDCGRNHTQTKRNYNRWYVRPLNWFYRAERKDKRYKKSYDFWFSEMRYGFPMIAVWGVNALLIRFGIMPEEPSYAGLIVIGLLSGPVYFGSYKLFDHHNEMYCLPAWIGQSKNLLRLFSALFSVPVCG